MRATLGRFLVALAVVGCGGDGGDSTTGDGAGGGGETIQGGGSFELPATTLTEQGPIALGDWDLEVSQDQQLGQAVADAAGAGFGTVAATGRVKASDGSTVVWAAYADGGGDERILAKGCDGAGLCRSGRLAENGAFRLADGADDAPLLTVAPAMLKDLAGMDHDGPTQLVAAALTADEVPKVDLAARRFVVLNAFGGLFGVDLSRWVTMAKATGAFSETSLKDYVSPATVEAAFGAGSPFDTVVWVGASVRQEFGPNHKTIGMTANRGIYGDQTVEAATLRDALKANPFGGPQLVVLVAEESRGDGSPQDDKNLSLFKELSDAEAGRIVVGFRGRGTPSTLLKATDRFLAGWFGGETLAEAEAGGNGVLQEAGAAAVMVSSRESAAAGLVFGGSPNGLWGEGSAPKGVRSTHYINITNKCFGADGKVYNENEGQGTFFADVDFDGLFFSGARKSEDVGLDIKVSGLLTGKQPGDRVYVFFEGDIKTSIRGITVWGSGVLLDKVDKDHPARIFYDGPALATDYQNTVGDTCIPLTPKLSGATSQPSWMDLP